MNSMTKKISSLLSLSVSLFSLPLLASFGPYETGRLTGTAGAGVGSVLLDEAAVLNPAPLAFYNLSSIYLQRSGLNFKEADEINQSEAQKEFEKARVNQYNNRSVSYGVILSDTKGPFKGSFGYFKQKEKLNTRQRFAGTWSSLMSEDSAFGLRGQRTTDTIESEDGLPRKERTFYQVSVGVLHVLSEELTVGLVANDPFESLPEESTAELGVQYYFNRLFVLMADGGLNYYQTASDSYFYKGALQISFFKDFFLRGGIFHNEGRKEKGNGVGLSWMGARVIADVALKNTTFFGPENSKKTDKSRDLTFSLSVHF